MCHRDIHAIRSCVKIHSTGTLVRGTKTHVIRHARICHEYIPLVRELQFTLQCAVVRGIKTNVNRHLCICHRDINAIGKLEYTLQGTLVRGTKTAPCLSWTARRTFSSLRRASTCRRSQSRVP